MTDQELREKIVKALEQGGKNFHKYFHEELKKAFASGAKRFGSKDCKKTIYDFYADALIEAGIGDVSEYKHRAERAERALRKIVEADRAGCLDEKKAVDGMFYFYLQQSEKELAEERKDD